MLCQQSVAWQSVLLTVCHWQSVVQQTVALIKCHSTMSFNRASTCWKPLETSPCPRHWWDNIWTSWHSSPQADLHINTAHHNTDTAVWRPWLCTAMIRAWLTHCVNARCLRWELWRADADGHGWTTPETVCNDHDPPHTSASDAGYNCQYTTRHT